MADKISYCSIRRHHIFIFSPLLSVNHLIWSQILASKHQKTVKMLDRLHVSFRAVHFMFIHIQDLCFSNLPVLEPRSIIMFPLTTSFVRIQTAWVSADWVSALLLWDAKILQQSVPTGNIGGCSRLVKLKLSLSLFSDILCLEFKNIYLQMRNIIFVTVLILVCNQFKSKTGAHISS